MQLEDRVTKGPHENIACLQSLSQLSQPKALEYLSHSCFNGDYCLLPTNALSILVMNFIDTAYLSILKIWSEKNMIKANFIPL